MAREPALERDGREEVVWAREARLRHALERCDASGAVVWNHVVCAAEPVAHLELSPQGLAILE